MTEVTFNISDSTMRALSGYKGVASKSLEDVTTELSDFISTSLERYLKDRIGEELGVKTAKHPLKRVEKTVPFSDITGISDGLSDEEEEEADPEPQTIEGESRADALVPEEGGLTDKDLEKDMEVENPGTEAKAEATFADTMRDADKVFAEVAGIPDHRVVKRKKRPGGKGRATPLHHSFKEEAGL